MNRLALLASFAAVLAACDKKDDSKPAPAGDKPAAAAPAKPAAGIDLPGNDPKIVELAKKVVASCKFDDQKVFDPFDSACPELKAWQDEKEAFKDGKGYPTLVAFIEDADEKVRYLGAKRLDDELGELTDKALVARVLTAAEKDKAPRDASSLGVIIGDSKVADPELLPRVKALVTAKDTNDNLRTAALLRLVKTNPDSDEVWSFVRDMAKDTSFSKLVQRSALEGFVRLQADKPARCDVFMDNLKDPPGGDVDHAGDALQWLSQARMKCEAKFDDALKVVEERIKAKTASSGLFGQGLRLMCDPKGAAKPPQLKKASALGRKLAEDKSLEGNVRANGIDASVACDPKGAKAYLGKFKKETDQDMKDAVARGLLAGKKK